jgi:hypothetical protein
MKIHEVKEKCYLETLEESITNVEMVINHLEKLALREGEFASHILRKDRIISILHLELALASYCVLLRKMRENQMIIYNDKLRADINSIIHSNRFEYFGSYIIVHSQKGKEEVDLHSLLRYGKSILKENES